MTCRRSQFTYSALHGGLLMVRSATIERTRCSRRCGCTDRTARRSGWPRPRRRGAQDLGHPTVAQPEFAQLRIAQQRQHAHAAAVAAAHRTDQCAAGDHRCQRTGLRVIQDHRMRVGRGDLHQLAVRAGNHLAVGLGLRGTPRTRAMPFSGTISAATVHCRLAHHPLQQPLQFVEPSGAMFASVASASSSSRSAVEFSPPIRAARGWSASPAGRAAGIPGRDAAASWQR